MPGREVTVLLFATSSSSLAASSLALLSPPSPPPDASGDDPFCGSGARCVVLAVLGGSSFACFLFAGGLSLLLRRSAGTQDAKATAALDISASSAAVASASVALESERRRTRGAAAAWAAALALCMAAAVVWAAQGGAAWLTVVLLLDVLAGLLVLKGAVALWRLKQQLLPPPILSQHTAGGAGGAAADSVRSPGCSDEVLVTAASFIPSRRDPEPEEQPFGWTPFGSWARPTTMERAGSAFDSPRVTVTDRRRRVCHRCPQRIASNWDLFTCSHARPGWGTTLH